MNNKPYVPKFQRVSVSKLGMVSTAHPRATEAGAKMLGLGGNAFDAAVAAAFALGVCEPFASGLGGQTMMLMNVPDKGVVALDGSSRVPNRAVIEHFSDKAKRSSGFTASTVPSTPAVLEYVLKQYGTKSLAEVIEPSIILAEEGYEITALQRFLQKRERRTLLQGNAGQLFLRDGEKPFPTGHIFRQPVLARTLKRIADKGIEDFYLGHIADIISNDMEHHGGFIRKDDLAHIPYPIEREPLRSRFGSMTVHTMPPPGAGRTLMEMIKILRRFSLREINPDDVRGALIFAETMRRAQLDRRDRPYDRHFYPQIEDERMLSPYYAKLVAKQISEWVSGNGETTHLTVMDRYGNVAALTQSIENVFGAKVLSPSLGFLYNNYMAALNYEDMTNPYYLRPNGVPWGSVAPTIVFRKNRPWLALGSPGSERIVSAVLQVLIRMARKQSPLSAVSAPRIHCSYTGRVSVEAEWVRDDIPAALSEHGFTVDMREPLSFYMGCVQMVMHSGGEFTGVADPRRDGSASGPIK